jgi:hypothetical protein
VTTSILSPNDLAAMVDGLIADGVRVIAPASGGAGTDRPEYRTITRLDQAILGGALPRTSLKEFFLPPTEVLLRYHQRKDGVDLKEVPTTFAPQVILAARPCDSAGVETMDEVMGWDYRDELWFGRRDATTIVSLACPGVDSTCFCSAVGIGPDSTKGASSSRSTRSSPAPRRRWRRCCGRPSTRSCSTPSHSPARPTSRERGSSRPSAASSPAP